MIMEAETVQQLEQFPDALCFAFGFDDELPAQAACCRACLTIKDTPWNCQPQQTFSSINCLGHGILLQQQKTNNAGPMLTAPGEALGR